MVNVRLKETSRGELGKVGRVLFPRCRSSRNKRGDEYGEMLETGNRQGSEAVMVMDVRIRKWLRHY